MAQNEAVKAVGQLVSAFRQGGTISDSTIEIYVDKLSDIDAALLEAAVSRLIETQKFFPAISEVRETAARLAGLLPITKAEALAVVRRADRSEVRGAERGGRGYVERYWDWPQDVDNQSLVLIQATLSRVGEPVNSDGKPHFGWETGFQDTYSRDAEEVSRRALVDLSGARLLKSGEAKRLSAAQVVPLMGGGHVWVPEEGTGAEAD